jgi:hypothetical protein
MIRREVMWAGAGAVMFMVLLEILGVSERLPWWLFVPLCLTVALLAAYIGDAVWQRRREADQRSDGDQPP